MDSLGLAKARATEAPALSSLPARGERRNPLATGERPWGCRTVLEEGDGYESEHWVVVAGTAQGRVGDREVHLVRRRPTGRGGRQAPALGLEVVRAFERSNFRMFLLGKMRRKHRGSP